MKSRIILRSFESVSFEPRVSQVPAAKPPVATLPHLAAPLAHGGLVTPAIPASKWIVTVGSLFPAAHPLTVYDCLAKK